MAYCAMEIAKYIIDKCTSDQCPISNLYLQEILYCTQKEFLEIGLIAFDDEFEAWQTGPVVPEVYYKYCGFGAMDICMRYDTNICSEYRNIIDSIVEIKRNLNLWEIVGDSHKPGKAWYRVYNNGRGNHCIITKKLIEENG